MPEGSLRGYRRAGEGLLLFLAAGVYYDYTPVAACTTCDDLVVMLDASISSVSLCYIRWRGANASFVSYPCSLMFFDNCIHFSFMFHIR